MKRFTRFGLIAIAAVLLFSLCACSSAKGGRQFDEAAEAVNNRRSSEEAYSYNGKSFILGDTMDELRLIAYSKATESMGEIASEIPLYNGGEIAAYALNFNEGYAVLLLCDYTVVLFSESGSIAPASGGELLEYYPPCSVYRRDSDGLLTDIFSGNAVSVADFGFELPAFEQQADEYIRTYNVLNGINRIEGKAEVYPRS